MNFRSLHKQPISLRIVALLAVAAPLLALSLTAAQTQDRGQSARMPVDKLPSAAKRWAIIIGVDDYESSKIRDLEGAVNDAKSLADALVRYAGFPEDQVIRLASDQPPQRKPTRSVILRYLTDFASDNTLTEGLLLFAFAGHGIERNDKAFLLPADAQLSNNIRLLEQTALAVDEIKKDIHETHARQVMVILDACRDDPTAGRSSGDNPLTESFIRGFNFDLRNREVDAFVTLHATSRGQRAWEYAEKKQGYFTYVLIEGLKGGATNERGEVTLANLLAWVEQKVPVYVRRDLGEQQKPYTVIEGYRASDLVLAVTSAPTPTPKPTPATTSAPEPTLAVVHAKVAGPPLPLVKLEFTTAKVDARGSMTMLPGQSANGFVEDLGKGVRLEVVEVASGSFLMGTSDAEAPAVEKEWLRYVTADLAKVWTDWTRPQHRVAVKDFYAGRYEVTQAQWKAVMGSLPSLMNNLGSEFKGDNLPVVEVSWEEAKEFCARLNRKLGLSEAAGYRLLTEAEWEYAARSRTTTAFAFGETITPEAVNYDGNSPYGGAAKGNYVARPVAVGSHPANAYGLFDMHGNVWEWCEDEWHENYKGAPERAEVAWSSGGAGLSRVIRGGGWYSSAVYCRSSFRASVESGRQFDYLGFRLARAAR